jgi:hypothetical protein
MVSRVQRFFVITPHETQHMSPGSHSGLVVDYRGGSGLDLWQLNEISRKDRIAYRIDGHAINRHQDETDKVCVIGAGIVGIGRSQASSGQ